MLSQLPIRAQLTLAFAAAMAVVLAAVGAFLFFRVQADLDRTIEDSLRSRADSLVALVRQGDGGLGDAGNTRLAGLEETFAQVLSLDGQVLDSSPQLDERPLLSVAEVTGAAAGTVILDRPALSPVIDERSRVLATAAQTQAREVVIVVGQSLEDRDETLSALTVQLLIIGPIALILASTLGYGLAAAAMRPVESMRREAQTISTIEPGRRLPVPARRDEIARLGETLNAMLARIEASVSRDRRFISDASHELRTPLAMLKTELELALRPGRTPDELEAALHSAAEETDRVVQLAEDLLVLARSDEGALALRLEQLDVRPTLERVVERFRRRVARAARKITLESGEPVTVVADELRLQQAVGNLVDNAVRHGTGAIVLSVRRATGMIELHVADDGAGFAPDFAERAFDRFSRPDDARSSGGAGLGLAIVKVIADAHRGVVGARNRTDGGADVWLSIPASQGLPAEPA